MKLKGKRSANLDDRFNPFGWLLPLIAKPATDTFQLPPMPDNPELNSAIRRQNKPTAADAAFNRRNPFLSGMDKALQQEQIKNAYTGRGTPEAFYADTGEPLAPWTPGDAWTTRKDQRIAPATKRDRPTKTDVIDYRQKQGRNPPASYPAPDLQRNLEVYRRKRVEEAKAFEKGLELARNKPAAKPAAKPGPKGFQKG